MEQSKTEKRAELAEHTMEAINRAYFGFIPGGHLIDEFLNYRSSLKQKRIINFSEGLKNALGEISGLELSGESFTTEEFVDVFESVINKVLNTNSEYKLKRFRNILVKQIVSPPDDELLTLKYIEFLNSINEIQLVLLDKMKIHTSFTRLSFVSMIRESPSENWNQVNAVVGGHMITILANDVDFYVNDLISKGLIVRKVEDESYDVPMLGGSKIETERIEKFKISETGIKFLKFIDEFE